MILFHDRARAAPADADELSDGKPRCRLQFNGPAATTPALPQ
jgi:hypothetical protein